MHPANHVVSSTAYTTSGDFCRIFADEMSGLYRLGFLLTADAEQAERCFVAGLGDCVKGNAVFKEWAHSWARRTVIQNAIRIMAPAQEKRVRGSAVVPLASSTSKLDVARELHAVAGLGVLERFVFVMSVLEGYSYQDCSILLGCSRQTVVNARQRALEQLARAAETSIMRDEERHLAAVPLAS